MLSFSTNTRLTRDCTSRCTLYNMADDTLVQASVIRFRSSCSVGGGVAYTRCLMYPHRKSPMGSGQVNVGAILRNHHTRGLITGMCPECTVGHLIPSAEGRRRVRTIHSGGHSTANPLENGILRPSFSLFFRVMSRYNFGSCEPNKYAFNAFYF
ncbi:hypothetical protein AVEN_40759-1 [Araneus ventricosus]|uniref:Uncharacterized protein n=1 Tax=Araneus ventricosus TaxID=182803 RepID=A0A4Y2X0I7_ARAVE|nr:hypothetical protein AVEN_40759-1 [Araneus ventricosus]